MPRIAPDSNDIIVQLLSDDGPTHLNTGTTGVNSNFTDYGNPIAGVPGLLGKAYYLPGSSISPNHDGTGGGGNTQATPQATLSGWIFLRRYSGLTAEIFHKQYFDNGWSAPFTTLGVQVSNTNDGRWVVYVSTGGTLRSLSMSFNYVMPQSRWCHVGVTWDGTNLRAYLNGTLVGSSVPGGGAIDYNDNTASGLWFVGAVPGSATVNNPPIIVQDVRVANVARPQSYFANIYYNGFKP